MDKFNLVVRAARELAHAVQENYYDLSDLNIINYSEVCDYVYLWTGSERINLTRMPESKRIELLKQFNIPE